MASGFESERSLAARKEERRRQREALLEQAKADYEKKERTKELKRLRGEDTWMLSDVNDRLEELKKEHSTTKKKKKEKHSKNHKKEKRKKYKVEKTNDSSDSSSESSEEWVEATSTGPSNTEKAWKVKKEQPDTAESPVTVQRDEWMTLDFMSVKTLSSASLKAEKQMEKLLEQEKAQAHEQSLIAERELNPYWKDGGTGLPPEEVTPSGKVAGVEDGGLSWLRKSYQRMKEQSEREKRDLDEIVAERYGSVELFRSRLEEAETSVIRKENDWKRSWQKSKYPGKECSMRQREAKEKQEESSTEKHSYKEHINERHNEDYSQEERHSRRDRPTDDREPKHSTKESTVRDFSYRTARDFNPIKNYEKPFLKPLKAMFLKPNDDGDQEGKLQSRSSRLVTPSSMGYGFRKPGDDDDDAIPRWRKAQPKEDIGKETVDEKSSRNETFVIGEKDTREKHKEIQKDALKKKEMLDSKLSYLGPFSEDEKPHILSDEDMNKLGAKIVKAELMGNKTTAFQEDHEVVLVRTDKTGRAWPVNTSRDSFDSTGKRRKKQMINTHVDKERVRYFQDDDNLSLKDLVRNEKMRTAEDQNKLFMRMASKFSDKTDRDYYTLDDMFVSKAAKGEQNEVEERRQRSQAIREHQQLAARMEKCPHCFGSLELPKHLIIAIGNKVYLSLPNYQSLTEGHCLIAPMQHYTAATLLDEDIWEEIQVFRKTLVKMFEAEELDCVFLETNLSIKKRYHMVYECIPLPKEVGDMAPIYFKKAIMESDEEWSMNKKLIDLSSKDVRKSVPKGLPYFSVDFGLQGGFAHVIEDQQKFPHYFGKEIIGGMLDLEPRLWRKGLRENFEDQRKKVLHFAQRWKQFDFTKNKT
ncbi:CWF19-like protein 2 isoform X2 [Sceloporus undulatus]|uniref:CWF19-like protein 2 isoform X2 n=1 Tax=Sceloporus undulatus TaxID=8520 RepID=UPI001C4B2A77|nr:CWF19-like protein 2 isoform X2 [Sceloporus undulatus]